LNVIYDDIDLDGDGMVGRIEKALTKDPVIQDNPFTLDRVAPGEEPYIATFRINRDYAGLSSRGKLQLLVDTKSERGSSQTSMVNVY